MSERIPCAFFIPPMNEIEMAQLEQTGRTREIALAYNELARRYTALYADYENAAEIARKRAAPGQ